MFPRTRHWCTRTFADQVGCEWWCVPRPTLLTSTDLSFAQMCKKRFSMLAIEVEMLRVQIDRCDQPSVRECLLSQILAKLTEMDEIMKNNLAELGFSVPPN